MAIILSMEGRRSQRCFLLCLVQMRSTSIILETPAFIRFIRAAVTFSMVMARYRTYPNPSRRDRLWGKSVHEMRRSSLLNSRSALQDIR